MSAGKARTPATPIGDSALGARVGSLEMALADILIGRGFEPQDVYARMEARASTYAQTKLWEAHLDPSIAGFAEYLGLPGQDPD